MDLLWIILAAIAIWYFYNRNKRSDSDKSPDIVANSQESTTKEIDEETVFSVQNRFEKKLVEEIDFPDAISHSDIYVYRELMAPWYSKLVAKYRYDQSMLQKLRSDWLEYIHSIEQRSTCLYLSFETEGKESEEYTQEHENASRKIFAIEEAFASALGEDAEKDLERVRKIELTKFSRHGELAPEGMRYDIEGKLKPSK